MKNKVKKITRVLLAACNNGDLESVKFHLKNNANVNKKRPSDGFFPLGGAVNCNHSKIVKLLISSGAHINMRSHCNWTPLYIAVDRGFTQIAQILISKGALLNVLTKADYASPDRFAPIHIACEKNHVQIVKLLVKAGAKINLKNGAKETAFDVAVKKRKYKLACYLALNGGKPASQKDFI